MHLIYCSLDTLHFSLMKNNNIPTNHIYGTWKRTVWCTAIRVYYTQSYLAFIQRVVSRTWINNLLITWHQLYPLPLFMDENGSSIHQSFHYARTMSKWSIVRSPTLRFCKELFQRIWTRDILVTWHQLYPLPLFMDGCTIMLLESYFMTHKKLLVCTTFQRWPQTLTYIW